LVFYTDAGRWIVPGKMGRKVKSRLHQDNLSPSFLSPPPSSQLKEKEKEEVGLG
jgi:hypothetical protein